MLDVDIERECSIIINYTVIRFSFVNFLSFYFISFSLIFFSLSFLMIVSSFTGTREDNADTVYYRVRFDRWTAAHDGW